MERIMREIRRRPEAVGSFPNAESAPMLAAARLRFVAFRRWGQKHYTNTQFLIEGEVGFEILGAQA
jgi:putative transposase